MNEINFQKTVQKYAILLAIGYGFHLVWGYYFHGQMRHMLIEEPNNLIDYLHRVPEVLNALINIVAAIFVYKDFKMSNVKSPLIVLITLFFGFIGIGLFFILVLYELHVRRAGVE
ncbi:MAG: hypothetical protein ABR572_12765 [Cryomorphaceae bacterium]|nr:hypothetical protein [Flavobacteriales bacterium]